jgi:hypothetical protein
MTADYDHDDHDDCTRETMTPIALRLVLAALDSNHDGLTATLAEVVYAHRVDCLFPLMNALTRIAAQALMMWESSDPAHPVAADFIAGLLAKELGRP